MEIPAEDDTKLEAAMSHDDNSVGGKGDDVRPIYHSFKKKYRKMRMTFDEKMRLSNEYFLHEQQALATAKRLAQMNNQTLDLLLDVNDSAQIPAEKRFDLSVGTPSISDIPPLIGSSDLLRASELNTPEGRAAYNEIRATVEEKEAAKAALNPSKSLASLISNTPHLSLSSPLVPQELVASLRSEDGQSTPLRYLSMDQVDEYLYEVDASLGDTISMPPPPVGLTNQDLALRNPHSVYNWLREHEPRVFLQDGEGSEKSSGKPGALRGAGKRSSIPAPSKPDVLEFVEEDGAGHEILQPSSAKGKRKRDHDDDGGYHPKSGRVDDGKWKKPRQARKKKNSDETAGGSAPAPPKRKYKVKEKNVEPSAPEGHPFGPM